jgi:hypothetical protein
MKKIFFTSIGLIWMHMLLAQVPEVEWMKTYGGTGSESSSRMIENTDGDYFFACSSTSQPSEERTAPRKGSRDIWVVKTDKAGNKIWDKAYGAGQITVRSMVATSDGGFIVGGNTIGGVGYDKSDTSRGNLDIWIIKVDRNGNKVWDKTLGGSEGDFLGDIILSPDGSILVGGYTGSSISGDKTSESYGEQDFWIIKLTEKGQYIWDKTYGGTGSEQVYTGLVDKDGNYLFGGVSTSNISGNKTDTSRGDNDGWLLKTDVDGNIIWDKTLGGDLTDYIQSMAMTSEGDYVLGIISNSNLSGDKTDAKRGGDDCWLVKVNMDGDILWQKTIGGEKGDQVVSVQIDTKESIYLVCRSQSGISADKKCSFGGGIANDSWIIITNQLGEIEWQDCYSFTSPDDAKLTDDGYVISGTKDGMRLIKLKTSIPTSIRNSIEVGKIKIYPNPTTNHISIQNNELQNNTTILEIYSIDGKRKYQQKINAVGGKCDIDFELVNGMYFIKIMQDNKIYTNSFVVNK